MVVGENGILNRATDASKKTQFASEKEALEFIINEMKIDSYTGEDSKSNIGKKLYDRNAENGAKWDMIIVKESGITYGSNCIFISKGSDLGNGDKAKSNWIIDKDGNLIELEDGTFTELDFSSTVGVTDGLIFNMDPNNLGEGQTNWGDNITLRYFNEEQYNTVEKRKEALNNQKDNYVSVSQQDNGYDRLISTTSDEYIDKENNAFKFNGNNYIEIYNENDFDFSNGITFEFYGKVSKDVNWTIYNSTNIGLFGIWNGVYNGNQNSRFGIIPKSVSILHCLFSGYRDEEVCGSYDDKSSFNPFNQLVNYEEKGLDIDGDVYLSISINPNGSKDNATQTVFMNNTYIGEGWLSKKYYEYFVEHIKESKYLELGRCTFEGAGNWCYPKGLCYCTRIYNKGLTPTEVKLNYDKTIAYREIIKN